MWLPTYVKLQSQVRYLGTGTYRVPNVRSTQFQIKHCLRYRRYGTVSSLNLEQNLNSKYLCTGMQNYLGLSLCCSYQAIPSSCPLVGSTLSTRPRILSHSPAASSTHSMSRSKFRYQLSITTVLRYVIDSYRYRQVRQVPVPVPILYIRYRYLYLLKGTEAPDLFCCLFWPI